MATDMERMFKDYYAAWNSHDVDKIVSFFTDDGVHEDVAAGAVYRGKNELKAWLGALFVASPDFKLELKSIFSAGDWVAQEWVMTGTQTGALGGIPATGKSFSVRGATITELRKDKIRREGDYWNQATLLQQLGVMPRAPS